MGDGEPRTATSTFTQLLSSVLTNFSFALPPQRPYVDCHTGPVQCCFTSTETGNRLSHRSRAMVLHVHRDRKSTVTQVPCNGASRPQRPEIDCPTGPVQWCFTSTETGNRLSHRSRTMCFTSTETGNRLSHRSRTMLLHVHRHRRDC